MSNLKKRIERLEREKQRSPIGKDPACICFPANHPPSFDSDEEEIQAAKVLCPIHGRRFSESTRPLYQGGWLKQHWRETGWASCGKQYAEAMRASFPESPQVSPQGLSTFGLEVGGPPSLSGETPGSMRVEAVPASDHKGSRRKKHARGRRGEPWPVA